MVVSFVVGVWVEDGVVIGLGVEVVWLLEGKGSFCCGVVVEGRKV